MHIFANQTQRLLGMETLRSLWEAIERIRTKSELDLLLLTGNISGDGSYASYETVNNLITPLKIPTYWLAGDCDRDRIMEDCLNTGMFSQRKVFERGGWHFILLNSCVVGSSYGFLSAQTLDWLEQHLIQATPKPTLIALHHPPFPIGSDWLDKSCLQNSEEFLAVLDRHHHVKLVLFGHIHQEYHRHRQGVDYLGTPSTCVQFQPQSSTFKLDNRFPGFRLLQLYPDGTWKTQVERIPVFRDSNIAIAHR